MRTHTLFTRATSLAVCLGILMSGPVSMAGDAGIIKDVELSKDGVLYGQVYTPAGQAVPDAVVQLRYQGTAVAAARCNEKGQFAINGVRGGAHEVVVGPLRNPVRLWSAGSAPKVATQGIVVAVDEAIVRGQDMYCEPGYEACPPTSGFGMLDVITLATVGAAVGALVVSIDNKNTLEDNEDTLKRLEAGLLGPASP